MASGFWIRNCRDKKGCEQEIPGLVLPELVAQDQQSLPAKTDGCARIRETCRGLSQPMREFQVGGMLKRGGNWVTAGLS
jgi:hypothetical protein